MKCESFFGIFTRNLSWTQIYSLDFETPREISIKLIRVIYAATLTLLSILKGTIDMSKIFRKEWNASLTFRIFTQNLSWAHNYILVSQTPTDMCIKEISVWYAWFIISLSILKGSIEINWNILEKREMRVLLLELLLKIRVEDLIRFYFFRQLERCVIRWVWYMFNL